MGQLASTQVNFAFDDLVLVKELTEALIKISELKGIEMKSGEAQNIAFKVLSNLDIDNPLLAHKGMYWLAKQILDKSILVKI